MFLPDFSSMFYFNTTFTYSNLFPSSNFFNARSLGQIMSIKEKKGVSCFMITSLLFSMVQDYYNF
jgi:hypothetical protein